MLLPLLMQLLLLLLDSRISTLAPYGAERRLPLPLPPHLPPYAPEP